MRIVEDQRHGRRRVILVASSLLGATPLTIIATPCAAQSVKEAVSILIDKSDRTLTLNYPDGSRITFKHAHFGSGWSKGPKRARYDKKTPEGDYFVVDHRTSGAYRYLPSLMLSYPNAADRAASKALGINDPGDAIMIHGPHPKAPFGIQPGDWTDGCIALTKKNLKVVMAATKRGTPVRINP